MQGLPQFSVTNRVLVHMGTLLVLVAGIMAYRTLPREEFQNVSIDAVRVRTLYPGASPEEVEKLVTVPIEDEIADVEDIDYIRSTSQEGMSTIWVEFKVGLKDFYRRLQEIQTEVDKAVPDLPEDAEIPEVVELEIPFPVIIVGLSGGASELELKRVADDFESDLANIQGVEEVDVAGVREREIWVQVDPERLEGLALTFTDVRDAIRAKNLNVPGGKVTIGQSEFLVRTMGEASAVADLAGVVIRSTPDGGQITVGDVATVTDTFEDARTLGRINGHRAVTLTVNKSPSGDTIEIVRQVRALVEEVTPGLPADIDVSLLNDAAANVARRFTAMESNGLMGFVLVLIVLYVFVGGRAALMTAAGIPIAFLGAIILMDAFDITFNMLSLFGLVMVLGMIVDDAIVVCENVYRHIEDGAAPMQAAVIGTQEVMGPVLASVTTTIAAFLPLLLFSGTMSKFLSVIPKVVIFALFASLVECYLALPAHLADFARPRTHHRNRRQSRWFQGLLAAYSAVLRLATRRRYLAVVLVLAGSASLVFFSRGYLRFQLFPTEDIQFFDINFELPVGTALTETERTIEQAESVVRDTSQESELENLVATIGFVREHGIGGRSATEVGFLRADLTDSDLKLRDRTGDEILTAVRRRLREIVGPVSIEFLREEHGPPVGKPVQVRIRGDDFGRLREIAEAVQSYLHTLDGVVDIKDDFTQGKEEIRIQVDEERAALYGLSVDEVAETVRTAVDGTVASTWYDQDEDIDVVVKVQEPYRRSFEDIESLRIPTRAGALVPFKNVAQIVRERGVSQIGRYDRKRAVHVLADLVKNRKDITSKTVNERVQAHFSDYHRRWPGYSLEFGGEFEETEKSLADLRQQFMLAMLLIYVILGATFRSFIQPLVVLCTVPFAFVGVVYGLVLSNEALGMMAFIGVIALAGIVVNDSIVLVTYINRARERGVPRMRAVIEGGQTRMRPIILTSVTTIFGLMPLATEMFGREPLLTSMAIAIVWGLTFSTVLTLVVIPAVYLIFDDAAQLLGIARFPERGALAETPMPPMPLRSGSHWHDG